MQTTITNYWTPILLPNVPINAKNAQGAMFLNMASIMRQVNAMIWATRRPTSTNLALAGRMIVAGTFINYKVRVPLSYLRFRGFYVCIHHRLALMSKCLYI